MKIRTPSGTRLPTRVTTPTANAMSVAHGDAEPVDGPTDVEQDVDRSGHDHPAERCERRQRLRRAGHGVHRERVGA